MRKLFRPPRPLVLDSKVNGLTEKERARDHYCVKKLKTAFPFSIYSHADVKTALKKMSGGRCAYCEEYYDATQPQDVEHFRPKGRVDTENGKLEPGYWWLASEWDNLLPSCIFCNRENTQDLYNQTVLKTGKGDRFPIADELKRVREEGDLAIEVHLLIDPCNEDPCALLEYVDEDGSCIIRPRAGLSELDGRRARASIDLYGLNRAGLVFDRSRYMRRIKISLRKLERHIVELDGADFADIPDIQINIDDEIDLLRTYGLEGDRFASLFDWLIVPALARFNISL